VGIRDAPVSPGKSYHVTVHDRLVALGADDRETREAEGLLARVVPLGRPIVVTDEAIAAARAGDAALLTMLLAAEVAPDADDLAAIADAAELDDGSRMSLEQVRSELQRPQ
jgi:cytochrome P450